MRFELKTEEVLIMLILEVFPEFINELALVLVLSLEFTGVPDFEKEFSEKAIFGLIFTNGVCAWVAFNP